MTLRRGLIVHFCPRPASVDTYTEDDTPEESPAVVCNFGKGKDGKPWATLLEIDPDSGQFHRHIAVDYCPVATPRTWHFDCECAEVGIGINASSGPCHGCDLPYYGTPEQIWKCECGKQYVAEWGALPNGSTRWTLLQSSR